MIPMIGSMMVPGLATATVSVEPTLLVVGLALAGIVAWMIRGTARELTRGVVQDPVARPFAPVAPAAARLAA